MSLNREASPELPDSTLILAKLLWIFHRCLKEALWQWWLSKHPMSPRYSPFMTILNSCARSVHHHKSWLNSSSNFHPGQMGNTFSSGPEEGLWLVQQIMYLHKLLPWLVQIPLPYSIYGCMSCCCSAHCVSQLGNALLCCTLALQHCTHKMVYFNLSFLANIWSLSLIEWTELLTQREMVEVAVEWQ